MTPDQMTELAARLQELASLYRTFNQTGRDRSADLAAAADLIAGMAQRVPLDDASIHRMWLESGFRGNGGQRDWFMEGCRAAEQAHGIRSEE